MLSKEVRNRIQQAVALGGTALKATLVPTAAHPTRNPWAHIWREIKLQMGKSYLDCDDNDEEAILEVIKYCVNNPVFEPILVEIARRTSVDVDRLGVSPTVFEIEDFTPLKYITLDGKRLPTGWSPEMEQDINMKPTLWEIHVRKFERELSERIMENACREILEHESQ